jgi:hypothetical protein
MAWHFIEDYTTESEIGYTTRVECEPILCKQGLHASRRILDALKYAPGPILCRVRVGGEVVHGDGKLAGTTRTILWTLDASHVLHEFACWCAESALTQCGLTEERLWNAIKTKRLWMEGNATDAQLRAAEKTATDATHYAKRRKAESNLVWSALTACSAAWITPIHSAGGAATFSARSTAGNVPWNTARCYKTFAAWSKAESESRSSQEHHLKELIRNHTGARGE